MFMFNYDYSGASIAITIIMLITLILGIVGLIWIAVEYYRAFVKKPIDKFQQMCYTLVTVKEGRT